MTAPKSNLTHEEFAVLVRCAVGPVLPGTIAQDVLRSIPGHKGATHTTLRPYAETIIALLEERQLIARSGTPSVWSATREGIAIVRTCVECECTLLGVNPFGARVFVDRDGIAGRLCPSCSSDFGMIDPLD